VRLALHLDLRESLLGGVANTVPVVVFGALVRRIIQQKFASRPAAFQLAGHLVLCALFSSLSYVLLIVLLGLFVGAGPNGFLVQPFSVSGAAWQSLENVTIYALIAAVSYLPFQHGAAAAGTSGGGEQAGALVVEPSSKDPGARSDASRSRYFVRIGDELRPLDMDTVVSIGGADDYAEVRTLLGRHLVRVTLAEFAEALDPANYVRVHRSWIVNIHRIARAEPVGGGRLRLHLETGQTIATSRAGAKLLRERTI
jgi:hypothetical protein